MYLDTSSRFLSLLFAKQILKDKRNYFETIDEISTKISSSIDQVVCKSSFLDNFCRVSDLA